MTDLGYNHTFFDNGSGRCKICFHTLGKHYEAGLRQLAEGGPMSTIKDNLSGRSESQSSRSSIRHDDIELDRRPI